jgi:hypothetical protein
MRSQFFGMDLIAIVNAKAEIVLVLPIPLQDYIHLTARFPLSPNRQEHRDLPRITLASTDLLASGGDKRPQSLMCFAHQGSALIKKLSAY